MTAADGTALDAMADGAAWPLPLRAHVGGLPADDRSAAVAAVLPARPGVIVFVGEEGRVLLVTATGDLRAAAEGRLSGDGPRADLAPVTEGVLACALGSGLEADWAQARLAEAWTPGAYREACARRRRFYLGLDPGADEPVWRLTDLADGLQGRDPAHVVGPFATRSAAEAFGRGLDERFELCREPSLLAQRPNATACVYKEMGKCPAPCDGSEAMSSYRARVEAALAFVRTGPGAAREELESRIASAAAEMDFETAARLKGELGQLDAFGGWACAWATTLDRFGVFAVLPSGRTGWARLAVVGGGGLVLLADVAAKTDEVVVGELVGRAVGLAGWTARTGDGAAEAIGVVSERLFARRKTRGTLFRLDRLAAGLDRGAGLADVMSAIRRAARVDRDDAETFETGGAPGGTG